MELPPIPTREEDAGLARLAKAGDQAARDRLALGHWRLVVWWAKKYRRCGLPMEDLVAEGHVGLLRAIDKFDPDRGVRFATYATFWINAVILRAIAEQTRLVRVPKDNRETRAVRERVVSLDTTLPDGKRRVCDLHEGRGPSPVDLAHESVRREAVEAALDRLDPREAQILRLRFGLADGREHTLDELGRIFGVTRERVRQLQNKALARLRFPGRLPAA